MKWGMLIYLMNEISFMHIFSGLNLIVKQCCRRNKNKSISFTWETGVYGTSIKNPEG